MHTGVICRCDSEFFCRVYVCVPLDLREWDDIVPWSPVTTVGLANVFGNPRDSTSIGSGISLPSPILGPAFPLIPHPLVPSPSSPSLFYVLCLSCVKEQNGVNSSLKKL